MVGLRHDEPVGVALKHNDNEATVRTDVVPVELVVGPEPASLPVVARAIALSRVDEVFAQDPAFSITRVKPEFDISTGHTHSVGEFGCKYSANDGSVGEVKHHTKYINTACRL